MFEKKIDFFANGEKMTAHAEGKETRKTGTSQEAKGASTRRVAERQFDGQGTQDARARCERKRNDDQRASDASVAKGQAMNGVACSFRALSLSAAEELTRQYFRELRCDLKKKILDSLDSSAAVSPEDSKSRNKLRSKSGINALLNALEAALVCTIRSLYEEGCFLGVTLRYEVRSQLDKQQIRSLASLLVERVLRSVRGDS